MSKRPLIEAKELCKTYAQAEQQQTVLEQLNMKITEGDSIAIVGASGSGKSTLLHLLGTLDLPSSGDVLIQGKSVKAINEKACVSHRQYLLQELRSFLLRLLVCSELILNLVLLYLFLLKLLLQSLFDNAWIFI